MQTILMNRVLLSVNVHIQYCAKVMQAVITEYHTLFSQFITDKINQRNITQIGQFQNDKLAIHRSDFRDLCDILL